MTAHWQALEAWSSGLNDTGYENVTSLLKNNCERKLIEQIGTPLVTFVAAENDTNEMFVFETGEVAQGPIL